MNKATHIRKKTGEKVFVENAYGIFIVRKMNGKVISSYEGADKGKFYNRYKSLSVKKTRSA